MNSKRILTILLFIAGIIVLIVGSCLLPSQQGTTTNSGEEAQTVNQQNNDLLKQSKGFLLTMVGTAMIVTSLIIMAVFNRLDYNNSIRLEEQQKQEIQIRIKSNEQEQQKQEIQIRIKSNEQELRRQSILKISRQNKVHPEVTFNPEVEYQQTPKLQYPSLYNFVQPSTVNLGTKGPHIEYIRINRKANDKQDTVKYQICST